ncbi:hypothetical protein VPH35_121481 [Triticum aestivum]
MKGAMSSGADETKYGAGMSRSPLQPQLQPIVGARLTAGHQGGASNSAPRSSGPAAGTAHVHAMGVSSKPPRRKRGRPRKNTPEGTLPTTIFPAPYPTGAAALLAPALPSSSTLGLRLGVGSPHALPALPSPLPPLPPPPPPPVDHGTHPVKQARVWPPSSMASKKQRQMAVAGPAAAGLIPKVITVQGGEDVTTKVLSYCGNGLAVHIFCANGVVRNVTLRQANSPHERVVYQGCFHILSLSGLYVPSKTNGLSTRKGGLGISFASPDGRVFGGGSAGPLIAASPIQAARGGPNGSSSDSGCPPN